MRTTIELYIGSNPDTQELEIDKIKGLIVPRHDRLILKGVFDGYWRGYPEDTYVVVIIDLPEAINETLKILEKELNGAAVAFMTAEELSLL